MTTEHTPGPWEFPDTDYVLAAEGEVTALVGKHGVKVLEIDWAGFSCESDPHGAYPILSANEADWALIKAAPDLLDAC
jgi:hypothetical protein